MSDPTKEQLNRIEHKLDLLLHHLPETAALLVMKDPMHCPVCHDLIEYQTDPFGAGVNRKCGCHPGVHGVGIPEALKEKPNVPTPAHPGKYGPQQSDPGDGAA